MGRTERISVVMEEISFEKAKELMEKADIGILVEPKEVIMMLPKQRSTMLVAYSNLGEFDEIVVCFRRDKCARITF